MHDSTKNQPAEDHLNEDHLNEDHLNKVNPIAGEPAANNAHPTPSAFQRYSQELSILNEIARTLNASVDLPTILEQALEKVAELFGLETGWVLLFDEATDIPYPAAAQNLPQGLVREPDRMTGSCYCLDAFREGDIAQAANVEVITCTRLQELALTKGDTAGLRYHASIPLRVYTGDISPLSQIETSQTETTEVGFKRLGMLNVAFPNWRRLTQDELELLYTVGDILSVAIERARLHANRLKAAQTAAQIEERNRLAREIHDTIAQDFSAISFRLEAAEALLQQDLDPARIRQHIGAALDLTRKGLEEARRSVLDLRAAPLAGRTLAQALAALIDTAQEQSPATISLETTCAIDMLPPALEVGLYRMAQEGLQNALRHAHASRITISLHTTPQKAVLTLEDDGVGFQMDAIARAGSAHRFGLIGMRERVRLLGGEFHLQTTPGTGVRIVARVPLGTPESEPPPLSNPSSHATD